MDQCSGETPSTFLPAQDARRVMSSQLRTKRRRLVKGLWGLYPSRAKISTQRRRHWGAHPAAPGIQFFPLTKVRLPPNPFLLSQRRMPAILEMKT